MAKDRQRLTKGEKKRIKASEHLHLLPAGIFITPQERGFSGVNSPVHKTIMMVFVSKFFTGLCALLLIFSCSSIILKPIHFSNVPDSPACGVPETMTGRAKIVDDLLRNKVATAEEVRLSADVGSPDKFVKIFKSGHTCTMVFHFIDRYDYDFIQGNILLKADTVNIEKGIQLDPASTVISEMSDQYYYIYLSHEEMRILAFAQSMSGKIGTIDIELDYRCRAGWRTLCEKKR